MKKLIFALLISLPFAATAQLGYTQSGEASYYADRFHGKQTASGERYNKNAYTAAHRDLTFGTRVRVQNLSNGKSVVVLINDRGPWRSNRILDLSRAAAKDLGMLESGTASIKLVVIGAEAPEETADTSPRTPRVEPKKTPPTKKPTPVKKAPPVVKKPTPVKKEPVKVTPPKPEPKVPAFSKSGTWNQYGDYLKPHGWGLQLGTFSTKENAIAHCEKVKKTGYTRLFIQQIAQGKGYTYKVVLGVYESADIARSNVSEIKKKGLNGFVIAHLE